MPTPKKQSPTAPRKPSGPTMKHGPAPPHSDTGWPVSHTIKALFYGRSGSGKTTLASTFPGKILWILCSGGLSPGELRSIDTPENRQRITPCPLHDTSELPGMVNKALVEDYESVVLDHVTGYQDLVLKEVLGLSEIPLQKNWGMARQDQYGQAVQQCKEAFRALINLACNVVFLGQERESDRTESSDVVMPNVGVCLFPKLAGWLNPAVDYIGQTFIRPLTKEVTGTLAGQTVTTLQRMKGQYEYCLRTGPDDVYTTKFRVPRGGASLPAVIVDPSYDKLIELIYPSP